MPPNDANDTARPWWETVGNFLTYWLWTRWLPTPAEEMPHEPAPRPDDLERGYEREPVNVHGIVVFGTLLFVMVGVTLAALVGLYGWFAATQEDVPPSRFADIERVPPPPRLQQTPAADMAAYLRRENERLQSYGWADTARTAAHIPIEQAMRRVAERGLPYDTTARPDTAYRTMSESGYTWAPRGPRRATAPPFLGGRPGPFVPSPDVLRALTRSDAAVPNWEERAIEQERQEDP